MRFIYCIIITFLAWVLVVGGARDDHHQDSPVGAGFLSATIGQPAFSWLLGRRGLDFGWGSETARAVMVLNAAGHKVAGWDAKTMESQLSNKQMDNQLLVHLLKNQTQSSLMAHYVLALAAQCRNGRDFYGTDIVVLAGVEDSPIAFTHAFNTLAVCAGGGHVKRRSIKRLIEFGKPDSPSEMHTVDLLAMVAMATSCIAKSGSKYHHLLGYVQTAVREVAGKQQSDGSFSGSVVSTALAVQALRIPQEVPRRMWNASEMLKEGSWRQEDALRWLRAQQKADGSFGDAFTTIEVLMALSGSGYHSVNYPDCLRPSLNAAEDTVTTTATTTTTTGLKEDAALKPEVVNDGKVVHFTYVVWIGQNRDEVFSIKLTVPQNSSFFDAMKIAAEADPRFEFSATVWPNGHYVHTINGHREQNIGFHFWLLFRLPYMPDPIDPPRVVAPHYVAVGGVDDEFPAEGDFFLFWFKDV